MRVVIPALISLALLALVFPTSFASSHPDPIDRDHYASWSAPLDFTGDLVVGFTIDFGASNHCSTIYTSASDAPEGGVRNRGTGAHFGGTGWTSGPAQVHHDVIDTRTDLTGSKVGVRISSAGPLSGTHDVTMTVFSAYAMARPDGSHWGPLAWELGCDEPFVISDKVGSLEAFGFTQRHMEGTGAAASAWMAAASVNDGTTASATFTTPEVRFDWSSYGNMDGTLLLTAPEDTREWDLTRTSRSSYTGGTGTYSVQLDRVGAGMFDDLVGVASGVAPVASWDDLF